MPVVLLFPQILQVVLHFAELLNQKQVRAKDLAMKFVSKLQGVAWLWDSHRCTWCTLQDTCVAVTADYEELAQLLQSSADAAVVHFIRFTDGVGEVLGASAADCRVNNQQGVQLFGVLVL